MKRYNSDVDADIFPDQTAENLYIGMISWFQTTSILAQSTVLAKYDAKLGHGR